MRGTDLATMMLMIYVHGLLLLAAINWRTSLLPDIAVLPLMWIGLLFAAYQGQAEEMIYGAAIGFLVPWALCWILKLTTDREALGYGDLKAFAMAGAWLGSSVLPYLFITFMAAVLVISVCLKNSNNRPSDEFPAGHVPSGVAHLIASVLCILGS